MMATTIIHIAHSVQLYSQYDIVIKNRDEFPRHLRLLIC